MTLSAASDERLWHLQFAVEVSARYHDWMRATFGRSVTLFKWDYLARRHTDLYQRFKRLQAVIARDEADWSAKIHEWEAEAQMIRIDEPPVFWAVYAMCWNQTAARHQVDRTIFRKVGQVRKALRLFFRFRPQDFPEQAPNT